MNKQKFLVGKKDKPNSTEIDEKKGTQAIDRALNILSRFSLSRPAWEATELSDQLGLTLPTTKRILKALESKGMLVQNRMTGLYELGLKVFELGAVTLSRISLVNQNKDLLIKLSEETRQTVHLTVIDSDEILYIKKIESSDIYAITSPDGLRRPLATGSLGKAILSTFSQAMLKAYLSKHPLVAYTTKSITDQKIYMEELAKVKVKGFAIDQEELIQGVCGVAAPISTRMSPAIGGIAIAFPVLRFDEARVLEWGELVRQAGLTISHRLSQTE